MLAPAGRIYVSGEVEIDTGRVTVRCAGEERSLRPKTFRLLVYLVENRERLVPKEELIGHLWPETAVTDGALAQCVADIRRALGEDSKNPRFIRTASRVGYQFIGPVDPLPSQALPLPASLTLIEEVTHREVEYIEEIPAVAPASRIGRGWLISPLAVLAAALVAWGFWPRSHPLAPEPEIRTAVLPFDNQSASPELDWMRTGLADMLSTSLSGAPRIGLVSPGQLQRELRHPIPLSIDDAVQAARRSGATALIVGSFASLDGTVRVDAKVFDARSGKLLGGESLTASPKEILTKLDSLATRLAARLGSPFEAQAPIAEVMTSNLEAYRLYSLGLARTRALRIQEAVALYEKAIALDPDFAMAQARIGYAFAISSADPDRGKPYLEKAHRIADRLTSRDRRFIHAWYAIASRDYEGAERGYREILAAYPAEIEVYLSLSNLLQGAGRFNEAREILERGLRIEPGMPDLHNMMSGVERDLGHSDQAIASARRYVELTNGEANAYDSLGIANQSFGKYAEAREAYERALARKPDFDIALVHLGNLEYQLGRYRDALGRFRDYVRLVPRSADRAHHNMAWVYWRKGDLTRADAEATEAVRLAPAVRDYPLFQAMIRGTTYPGLNILPPEPVFTGRGSRPNLRPWYSYAGAVVLRERGADALEYFRAALREPPAPWIIDPLETWLGDALLGLGRLDEAEAEYRRVLSGNPNYPMALYRLGLTLERKGNKREARKQFERFRVVWKDADPDLPEIVDARKRLLER